MQWIRRLLLMSQLLRLWDRQVAKTLSSLFLFFCLKYCAMFVCGFHREREREICVQKGGYCIKVSGPYDIRWGRFDFWVSMNGRVLLCAWLSSIYYLESSRDLFINFTCILSFIFLTKSVGVLVYCLGSTLVSTLRLALYVAVKSCAFRGGRFRWSRTTNI